MGRGRRGGRHGGGGGKKKSAPVTELLGLALGRLSLSLDDFCRLTPDEFAAVCRSRHMLDEYAEHSAWERTRIQATLAVQPHLKRRLTPHELLPLPWDNPKRENPDGGAASGDGPLGKAEQLRRFEELVRVQRKD